MVESQRLREHLESCKREVTVMYKGALIRLTISHQKPWKTEGPAMTYLSAERRNKKTHQQEFDI